MDIVPRGIFPSQTVSNATKASESYGLEVGKAIESEWFKRDSGPNKYYANRDQFHRLRLYARGEQSIQKYKDELSINGDLSYLNLDWKPVPIIPKFIDIVVNGIAERTYDIKAYSQDPLSIKKRTDYVESMLRDMRTVEFSDSVYNELGINIYENDPDMIPETEEDLELHMQLDYKDSVEIAEEEAINNVMDHNKYDLIKKRLDYDIAVVGMGAVKNEYTNSEGINIKYVDPADLVYSYTESPYFDDIYYIGEIRKVSLVDLKKQYPDLTDEDIKKYVEGQGTNVKLHNKSYAAADAEDFSYAYVLYFEYKTYRDQVYKIKETATGGKKALAKEDTFNPPKDKQTNFSRLQRSVECIFEGAIILGTDPLSSKSNFKFISKLTLPSGSK